MWSENAARSCLFLVVTISSCYAVDIGKYLKTCNRDSPDVNDCLVDAIQHGLGVLSGGIPEIGVPAVDPYTQKDLRIDYKNNQIKISFLASDIVVEGLKEATVYDARLRADEEKFHLEVDLKTPRVHVMGKYSGEGGYDALQIKASGEFETNMTDLVFTWKLDGVPEKRNNETYMRIVSFYMRPDVGDMKTKLVSDSPANRGILELANRVANENWRQLYREFLPFAQTNWNKIGIRVANKLFLKVPYDQLFPGGA